MQILADLNNFEGTDTASRPTSKVRSHYGANLQALAVKTQIMQAFLDFLRLNLAKLNNL